MAYQMLDAETASTLTKEKLLEMYNDAVETIWELQHKYQDRDQEYDLLLKDFEDLIDQIQK